MLQHLFPRSFQRFRSLPLLGPIAEEFAGWLVSQRYREGSVKHQVRTLIRIDGQLRQLGLQRLHELTVERLRACAPAHSQDDRLLAATLSTLERFLTERDLLCQAAMTPVSRVNTLTKRYADYLKDFRSLAPSTIHHHLQTAVKLLEHLSYETAPRRLQTLTPYDVEQFVHSLSGKYGRGSMQHIVAHLRGLLRFLAMERLVPLGLDSQIDTPRLYRFEQLPRALDWDTVGAFLQSIDRTSPMGLRNHAMFFLMATFGLRPCEIVALTLEDFHWRAGCFRVPQRKTGTTLR